MEHDSLFLSNEEEENLRLTCLQYMCLEICIKYRFIINKYFKKCGVFVFYFTVIQFRDQIVLSMYDTKFQKI